MIFHSKIEGGQALVAYFREMPERLRDELRNAIFDDLLKLQKYVVTKELAGQALKRVTGTLAASVTPYMGIDEPGAVIGILGANTPYARILEYGGSFKHPGGTAYLPTEGGYEFISNAAADALPNLPRTKPHFITIPTHAYMRPALFDMRETIKRDLRAAATRALKG